MLQELEEATQMKGRFKYAENAGDTVFNLQPYVYWLTAHIAASPSGAVAKDMKTESYIFFRRREYFSVWESVTSTPHVPSSCLREVASQHPQPE